MHLSPHPGTVCHYNPFQPACAACLESTQIKEWEYASDWLTSSSLHVCASRVYIQPSLKHEQTELGSFSWLLENLNFGELCWFIMCSFHHSFALDIKTVYADLLEYLSSRACYSDCPGWLTALENGDGVDPPLTSASFAPWSLCSILQIITVPVLNWPFSLWYNSIDLCLHDVAWKLWIFLKLWSCYSCHKRKCSNSCHADEWRATETVITFQRVKASSVSCFTKYSWALFCSFVG